MAVPRQAYLHHLFALEHDVANPLLQEMKNKIQNQTLK